MGRRAVVVLLALVLVACGGDDDRSTGTSTTAAPATTTTVPQPEGISVLLLGDSVMDELSAALTAGVTAGGVDRATFRLGPSLPHTPGDGVALRRALEDVEPDVVVLHVGHWERLEVLGDFATGARVEPGTYRSGVIDPFLDLLEDAGTELVWLSPIPVEDADEAEFVDRLAALWQEALVGRAGVEWVDLRPAIAPDGVFVAELPGPGGALVRVRRADGLHVCPNGQRRVADAVLRVLAPRLGAPPPPGWSTAWRATVDEPGGCEPTYRPPA